MFDLSQIPLPSSGDGARPRTWQRVFARQLNTDPIKRALRYKRMIVGVLVLLLVLVSAVLGPLLSSHDPTSQNLPLRLRPPLTSEEGREGSRSHHILGTDHLGRDVTTRLFYGGRISLLVGLSSVALAAAVGLLLGLLAGNFGGVVDSVIMRIVDLQLAFPFILLALAIVALLGPSLRNIIIVFAITSWPIYARTVRPMALSIREKEFIEAARAAGAGHARVIFRHILPNVASPLIVIASFEVAKMVIMEAAMGFLGLGVPPPTPTWGNMLADGRDYIRTAWWLTTFPGLAIMVTATGINLLGDALRDIFDPRLKYQS